MSDTTPTAAAAPAPDKLSLGRVLRTFGLLIFLALNVILVSVLSPAFLKVENLLNVLTQAAPLGIVVIGQTFVLLVRGLDLSVASVMATSAVLATSFATTDNAMMPVIFAAAKFAGGAMGTWSSRNMRTDFTASPPSSRSRAACAGLMSAPWVASPARRQLCAMP